MSNLNGLCSKTAISSEESTIKYILGAKYKSVVCSTNLYVNFLKRFCLNYCMKMITKLGNLHG